MIGGCTGEPADTGAEGVVQGARVLATEAMSEWGAGAPRTGVVNQMCNNPEYVRVKWDDDGSTSDIAKSTCMLLE